MPRYDIKSDRGYPKCPDCGLDNYVFACKPGEGCWYEWDGPRKALDAGRQANLYTKRGRIYGGGRKRWSQGTPTRVNERKWKIVRSGVRLLIACANKFHEVE